MLTFAASLHAHIAFEVFVHGAARPSISFPILSSANMAIDININNQNKHWILVILEKAKNLALAAWALITKGLKRIGELIKRTWKILVGIAAFFVIIGVGTELYDYYTYTYLPKKLLDDAVADVESKLNSTNDSIKLEYALHILNSSYVWDYKGVYDSSLRDRLEPCKAKAFKYIEDKAYAGDARCQFNLGQVYYFEKKDNNKAVYWWNEAAQQGYADAYNNVGIAYRDGLGVEISMRKAVEWLKKGAEAGEASAQCNYGDLFRDGAKEKVGSHKEQRVTSSYRADRIRKYWDDTRSQSMYVYLEEIDDYETLIPQDIEQAKYWWKKAAAKGHETAKERLQQIYN